MSEQQARECPVCTRPTDGFACETCADQAAGHLRTIADLSRYADEKRARMTTNWRSGTIGRTPEQPLPYDPRVTRVLDPIKADLRSLAQTVTEDAPEHGEPASSQLHHLAGWLADAMQWLRMQVQAVEEFGAIKRHHDRIVRLFDRPPDLIYVGRCDAELAEGRCTESLYVERGPAYVRCSRCATVHDIDSRRDALADGVDEYLGTIKEISRLCRLTLGEDVSVSMIHYYARVGMIQSHGERIEPDKMGRPRAAALYRIGEVRQAVQVMARDERKRRRVLREVNAAAGG